MLAIGFGVSSAALVVRLATEMIPGADVHVRDRSWGAYLVSGTNWLERGSWLVMGTPTTNPWGIPGDPPSPVLGLGTVVDELEEWGAAAITMTAGPVVCVDLDTGFSHSALNGIIQLGRQPDDHQIWTTTVDRRDRIPTAIPIADTAPGFAFDRLVGEIESRLPPTKPGPLLVDPTDNHRLMAAGTNWAAATLLTDGGDLIVHPEDLADVFRSPQLLLDAHRSLVPMLARRAERLGFSLYAPFLERPVLDQIGLGWSAVVGTAW